MSDKEELTRELAEVFDADKIESVVKKRPMPNRGHQKGKIKATSQDVDLMKERVIHLLRQGKTRQEAMSEVDRNPRTYYSWAWADSRFEQRAQAAMKDFETAKVRSNMTFAQIRDEFEPVKRENYKSWTEYVVAFRKAYFGFDTFDHQWQILQAWENSPPGGISLILVPPEAGKALALDTPLPTPTGWTTMEEVKVGDELLGSDGKPCRVTAVSEIFVGHRCFEVIADDGASVIADENHLWPVVVSGNKGPHSNRPNYRGKVKIKTTLDLVPRRSKRPRLQMASSLDLPEADLLIDPYVLGVWLGDGASAGGRIYCSPNDAEIIRPRFETAGYETRQGSSKFGWSAIGLQTQLRTLGLLNNKHIPVAYLRASTSQRIALLQGLIDTDGYVALNGLVEFINTNPNLANDVLNLVRSLGIKASLSEGRATLNGRDISAKYRVTFFSKDAAYLPRKAMYCKDGTRRPSRYLEAREVPSVPTRCIAVDSPDHLYLAGEGYLVTHNTTLLADTIVADLCSDPNTRRSLVSEGQDLARKTMGRIQRRLVYDGGDMPALISHFGPFVPTAADRGKKWNADEFTILASNHDEADPSCVSVGAGSNIRGARWDAVDLDDIQSIKSVNKTAWLLDIFRGDIVTRPGKDGRIRITGSRVARGDFYEELERLDLVDEIVVIPALDLTKPLGHQSYFPLQYREDGTPVLDEKGKHMGWSDAELLQRKKKVGDDMWSRVYMMRPQSDFAALLTAEDIAQASDHDRIVGQTPKNAVATMASLDPSLAAYAAFTYSAYNADHLYVMEVKNYFRPNTNQNLFAEIYRGSKFYHPSWWVIENNTLQRGYLTDDAFIAIKKEFGFQSVGHHTGDNKQDPQLGVPAMMEAIRRGEIRFPRVTEHDTDFATLFDQLLAWRPDIPTKRLTQDLVMSLWFSYLRWKQLRQVLDTDLSGWKRDGLGSITLYAGARTNLEGVDTAPHPHVLETYDQVWNRLTAKESA